MIPSLKSYVLRKDFPIKRRNNEPAIATRNAVALKLDTERPKIRFAMKPPIRAPTIPNRLDPTIPLLFPDVSIVFARIPTIKPKRIQDSIFM
jgi:hypothetical protein